MIEIGPNLTHAIYALSAAIAFAVLFWAMSR